tara:strand:- start:2471 stop:4033 length:1563 start_codon:yes stop_codon:yes gene_type:complete
MGSIDFKFAMLSDTMASDINYKKTKTDLNQFISGNNLQHVRPNAPYKVAEIFRKHGYDSTVFNYINRWEQDILVDTIEKFSDSVPLIVGVSLTLNTSPNYVNFIGNLCKKIKNQIPNVIVVVGGLRNSSITLEDELFNEWADVLFFGRSLNLLKRSIHDKLYDDLHKGIKKGIIRYTHPNNQNLIDEPVLHDFSDNDLWTSKDVPVFESTIGCKFNCTFCNYDFRAIKNPQISAIDNLVEFFSNAHSYGVTHFFTSDDTINESDEKLDVMVEAVKQLDFVPTVSSFTRLDIMHGRTDRIQKLADAGLDCHFFGIESFNHDANKKLGKGNSPEKLYETLKEVKNIMPNSYLFANCIAGLSGDTEESIWYHTKKSLEEGYLDALNYTTFTIMKPEPHFDFNSAIDKDPEKFGYTIIQDASPMMARFNEKVLWKNEWTDYKKAEDLSNSLKQYILKEYGAHRLMSNFAYTCLSALGLSDRSNVNAFGDDFVNYFGTNILQLRRNPIEKYIEDYINKKVKQYNE